MFLKYRFLSVLSCTKHLVKSMDVRTYNSNVRDNVSEQTISTPCGTDEDCAVKQQASNKAEKRSYNESLSREKKTYVLNSIFSKKFVYYILHIVRKTQLVIMFDMSML